MSVITRFAPSPTGSLHLGGARTALFNWLFAKNKGGKFLLRLEDTDRQRSSDIVAKSILDDLAWLGLGHDGEVVVQSLRTSRHNEVAQELILREKAYYCFCSEEEINYQREECEKKGIYYKHLCPWKDASGPKPESSSSVIRLKSPSESAVAFIDGIYGKISVANEQIDDMVIIRSDGTPTYQLAVVVDDHDMGITHIIRGSDHLNNTAKQIVLARALQWNSPEFYHMPLIHDENGAKLSKRNKAPGIHEYRELGFLPEAICNYLLRMGWSYQDKEIVSIEEAIELFSVKNIGVSCSCLDYKKLMFLNHHYLGKKSEQKAVEMLLPVLEEQLGYPVSGDKISLLHAGVKKLLERAKTLVDLARDAKFYVQSVPIDRDLEAQQVIAAKHNILPTIADSMSKVQPDDWKKDHLAAQIKELSSSRNIAASDIYHLLRALIVGRLQAPSISEIMEILGKEECLLRITHS
ncbi:glutamyl-Q tRNA(Asp) synthetase [Anaplasma platys]|uniref:Glutamate--tRNA ligase n=1 Tax=Anaplasma platys TaxID=949 RepID=A0A858PY01_9RICK|nr:glutamate--tRNA ligase [Anaplasma platys]QJC27450.1 glutamyl-Q tRNA(Asp) synthetase [Anaplasma platys]